MTGENILEKIIETIRSKVDEYIVIIEEEDQLMLKLANGKPSVTQSWNELNVNLYVAKNGKMAMSNFRTSSPEEAISKTLAIIDKLQPSPLYAPLPQPSGSNYQNIDNKIIETVVSGDIQELITDLDLPRLETAAGAITLQHTKIWLETSMGGRYHGENTAFHGYIRIFRKDDVSGQWSWTSSNYDPRKANRAIEKAVELADLCNSLPSEKISTGKYDILLSPMVVGNLFETVTRAANGAAIIFGMSFFKPDEKDKQVASEKLTLLDLPTYKDLPGYRLFDDEAVATRDKPIIEKGTLKTILHNSKTAKLLGTETTGNAGIIWPHAFNLKIEPGEINEDELYEVLNNGIYATNNWYTRFQNYVEGTFSTVTRDAVIIVRSGKPKACTQRIRITGSIRDLIMNITGVSKLLYPIQWWEVSIPSLLPHLLVKETPITSE